MAILLAIGHAGLIPGFQPAETAAPQPHGRGDGPVKIARIESFIFGTGSSKDLLFCRVETEDGTHGWGEAYVTAGKETVIADASGRWRRM